MKQIIVAYWMGVMIESIGIKHNQIFQYSEEKRNEIINLVLDNNLQLMTYKQNDDLIVWIDNRRFRQR